MGDSNGSSIVGSMKTILDRENTELISLSNDVERIYSFIGPLTDTQIQEIAATVESRLLEKGLKKSTVKRTFTILIEGLQNAHLHGLDSDHGKYLGLSVFIVGAYVDITILGVTDKAHFEKVSNLVHDLNAMAPEAIKSHYLEVMTNGKVSAKGGAGLGLITMVMKSNTGIELGKHDLSGDKLILSSKMSA